MVGRAGGNVQSMVKRQSLPYITINHLKEPLNKGFWLGYAGIGFDYLLVNLFP